MNTRLPKKPNEVDREIGLKLRKWRLAQEMEAGELASKLGVTYQQLRKYEKGLTRISASRLYEISQTLDVPIHWFFRENHLDTDRVQPALFGELSGKRQSMLDGVSRRTGEAKKSPLDAQPVDPR
ncbi:transcriptional regulator with XRE-family HTH domain [Rhizomicrobium palustre]|uniref:Transcriptional regulator with XRE-family HTH domain n=1 Tax=Rhizomicrobium palustre TaxID=189966 RepID=A0A846N2A7_9PROT|nr:helix-turn-helix transcriptional regulator [Rhizomicrobium palustre]NIK89639.1 transcriptional regulator with XRE-family HTH domain [Rhizomicrobium palustre]